MITQFNIRVYALAKHRDKILILKEPFMNQMIYKFPGGGLEFGEGTIDCLKREFKEELNLEIEEIEHFYTQENFIKTSLLPNKQLLLIYYKVRIKNIQDLKILDPAIEEIKWVKLEELNPDLFSLPVDKIVLKKLFS